MSKPTYSTAALIKNLNANHGAISNTDASAVGYHPHPETITLTGGVLSPDLVDAFTGQCEAVIADVNTAKFCHRTNAQPDALAALIKAGTCAPVIVYDCPAVSQVKVICQIKAPADLWGGLIIGTAGGHSVVVTGYSARLAYWQSAAVRDSCVQAVTP